MGKKSQKQTSLPAGFQRVGGSGDFPPVWKPEKAGQELRGIVIGKREADAAKLGRQNAKKGEKVIVLEIADENGEIRSVFQSFALTEICKLAKLRDEVYLRFDGVKKLGKKRLNQYTAAIKGKGK